MRGHVQNIAAGGSAIRTYRGARRGAVSAGQDSGLLVLLQAAPDDADSRQPASERRSERRLQRPFCAFSILLDAHHKRVRARTFKRWRMDAGNGFLYRNTYYSNLRS